MLQIDRCFTQHLFSDWGLTGCHSVAGGGWIRSTVSGKATFGFTGRCVYGVYGGDFGSDPIFAFYEGQLEYVDAAAGVRIHADIDPGVGIAPSPAVVDCKTASESTGGFWLHIACLGGPYRVQPPGDDTGTGIIRVEVTDNGEPGIDGDTIYVHLVGGPHDGYVNFGTIRGGNVIEVGH